MPWGESRKGGAGTTLTDYGFTGQRKNSYIKLVWYGSRWFDPELARFIQPDSIIPSIGEGNSNSSIGYVSKANYSPLVVDYHEEQLLDQLNNENLEKLLNKKDNSSSADKQSSINGLSSLPNNSLAFDRYAYCFNNPVRYVDPVGHDPEEGILGIGILVGLGVTIGAPEIIIVGGVVVLSALIIDAVTPGAEQRHQDIKNLATQAGNSLTTLFAKGEYKPSILQGDAERNAYREAVHKYKTAYNLGAADDVPKEILDKIAELIKEGVKPVDIPYEAPQPPEYDDEDEDQ